MAGWLPQMTVYLFPWYALGLIRTLRKPTLRRSILLGLLTGVTASVYVMHIAYIMLPLTLVIVGAYLIRIKRRFFERHRVRNLALAGGIALLVVVPFLVPLVRERFGGGSDYLFITGIVQHSTDLLAFITPSPYHPVLAPLGLVPSFASQVFEDAETMRWSLAYVGLVPVLLSLWGTLRSRPRPWSWVVLALGAAIFAMGPLLVVGGAPFEYEVDGIRAPLLLPYALVREIPLLDWGRTPGRINVVGMLAVGVLAAYGTTHLLSRLSQRRHWQGLSALVLIVLVLFEFLPLWPFPSGDATAPPVIQRVASHPGDGAVLNLPMQHRRVNHRSLYFQTFTERPIVGGVVHRWMPETVPWWETIQGLVIADVPADAVPRPDNAQRQAWLRHFNVDWVLFHRVVEGDEAHYRPFLEELLGEAVEEDDSLVAYAVPDRSLELEETLLYTFSEQGWRPPESDDGLWRRWMYDDGSLYIYSALNQVGVLSFTVDSHLDFPVLEVHLEGALLDAFVVGDRTVYNTRPFTLSQGMNVFSFHTRGGCPDILDDARCWSDALLEPPAQDVPLPCDAQVTCRSFVFDSVSFVPEENLPPGRIVDVNFGDQMRLRGWRTDQALHPGDRLV